MAMQATREVVNNQKAVVEYKGERITISFSDVKNLICPLATDQEVAIFLKTCQSLNLNPFAGEIFLIKYSEKDKAATVIAIDSYLKASEANEQCDGHEAGIILKDSAGRLEFREGAFLLDDERLRLVGGWARVYRKDRSRPFYVAVNKKECLRYRRDGSLTEFWTEEKQPSMLRKTALKRALVEAFPSLFSGVVSNVDYEVLAEPREEIPEGELPAAYTKNGEPDWRKFWVRQKEKGLSPDEVHDMLGITSLKEDWIGTGRTLEEAEEIISASLPLCKRAEKLGLSINQIHDALGMSLREWFAQGKSVDEAIKVILEKLAKPKESAEVGEGFAIDLQWLKEAKQTLKWTDETMMSFITSQYKVSGKRVTEALGKLTREQAEDFVKEINKKLEKQTSLF